jgi:lipoate synthase
MLELRMLASVANATSCGGIIDCFFGTSEATFIFAGVILKSLIA